MMNNQNNEKLNKKSAKITGVRGLVFAAGLLTLMGCGKTVVDDTVSQTPTTSIETTVTDPVDEPDVTIPVVEGAPVDEPEVTPVEEDKPEFADATFVQTGENEYTIYVDYPDNSESSLAPDSVPMYEDALLGVSEGMGIPPELINAVFTYGLQVDRNNPVQANIDSYVDIQTLINVRYDGSTNYVIVDNQPGDPYDAKILIGQLSGVGHVSPNSYQCDACALILKDAIINCDGNLTCALERYNIGPENWDKIMKECMDATGLTAEQIYANYDAEYVLQYDSLGLGNLEFVGGVLQYINEPIVISYYDENGMPTYSDTYTMDRVKTYGTI